MSVRIIAEKARAAAREFMLINSNLKRNALHSIAKALNMHRKEILSENKKDCDAAALTNLPNALIKRLMLDDIKINELVTMVTSLAQGDDPCGKVLEKVELDKGLILEKVAVPIGVIGVIFESRPDALVQIAALALQSGNAVILKGGSESMRSNRIIAQIMSDATAQFSVPKEWLQILETREQVKEMLELHDYIDLLIPRGSNEFVRYIMEHTSIPVLGHASGVCTIYVDEEADKDTALKICYDAKVQYPAACNAVENLLVHRACAREFLEKAVPLYLKECVELRCDDASERIARSVCTEEKKNLVKKASEKDWSTEYNDLVLSIKIVEDVSEAVSFINTYGSHHTDAIATTNKATAEFFLNAVDSSSVFLNCSTRFSDGYRYGKGAEVGISTMKIHARGPVGVEGLMIYKYKLMGSGHIVSSYTGKNAKPFIHRKMTMS